MCDSVITVNQYKNIYETATAKSQLQISKDRQTSRIIQKWEKPS